MSAKKTCPLCATAQAAREWRLLFERGIVRVSVDEASVATKGGTLRAWLLFDFAGGIEARDGRPAYVSSTELRRVDCTRRTSGLEQQRLYDAPRGDGALLRAMSMRQVAMEPVAPGSLGEAIISSLCLT